MEKLMQYTLEYNTLEYNTHWSTAQYDRRERGLSNIGKAVLNKILVLHSLCHSLARQSWIEKPHIRQHMNDINYWGQVA